MRESPSLAVSPLRSLPFWFCPCDIHSTEPPEPRHCDLREGELLRCLQPSPLRPGKSQRVKGGSWRAHLKRLGRPPSSDGVRPICFIMSLIASHLCCQPMLRGSLGNTWCEVPTSHVFGRWVESQIFQRRIVCFAKPMSKGAVYLAATRNARALRQSGQVKDLARFLGCMMKLLASQIFQLAQTTSMQISRNVLCQSHLPSSVLPHRFSTSFPSSQLQCQLVLPGSLATRGGKCLPRMSLACVWRARRFSAGCCALQRP